MWCKACRQDVPGIVSRVGVGHACARCGATIRPGRLSTSGHTAESRLTTDETAGSACSSIDPLASFDNWESNENLLHTARILDADRQDAEPWEDPREFAGIDMPHQLPAGWHPAAAIDHETRSTGRASTSRGWSILARANLLLGLAAFVCGTALSGWSLIIRRAELWDVGMPIALGGQVALLLGLILQLEGLGQANRRQAEKLDHVDRRLGNSTGLSRIDLPGQLAQTPATPEPVLTGATRSKNIPPPFTPRPKGER